MIIELPSTLHAELRWWAEDDRFDDKIGPTVAVYFGKVLITEIPVPDEDLPRVSVWHGSPDPEEIDQYADEVVAKYLAKLFTEKTA